MAGQGEGPFEPWDESFEGEPYEPPLEGDHEPWQGYEEPAQPAWEPQQDAYAPPPRGASRRGEPVTISTNMTINLTCLLAALNGILGLFFYFADRRSVAVRRTATQSAGWFITSCFVTAVLWILAAALGAVPLVGGVLGGFFWILWILYMVLSFVLRWRFMLYAYRGQAYVFPVVGERFRSFE